MRPGERIRQLRIHKNMTQGELVEGVCSITYLSRIENGQTSPSKSFLIAVANKLGIDPEDLTDGDRKSRLKRISQIIQQYRKNREICEEDEYFLRISSLETYSHEVYLQIYATLISLYLDKNKMKEANSIYDLSIKFIPETTSDEESIDFYYYYVSCGNLYYYKQDYIKSNELYEKAENFVKEIEGLELGKLYYNISLVKQKLIIDQNISLYYSKKAYEIFSECGQDIDITKVLITQAVQYNLAKKYSKSVDCLQIANQRIKENPNEHLQAMVEYNFGRVYQEQGEYDKAIIHYERCIELRDSMSLEREKIHSYQRLVQIYHNLKDWIKVNEFLEEAIRIAKEHELTYSYIQFHMMKATIYKDRFDEAKYEKETQRIIDLAIETNQIRLAKEMASNLGDHFVEKRAYKKAAEYYKLSLAYEV
ncbi:helix-turn-helix domain-containing protein [Ectobacillus panaciterrae]|uniref:helix-turn-helix domain-containing protein n=1 Tax=Ectobacillus panaciterrae TaxID=363872 RepID=UPI000421F18C|nr:helix-turn-helix transcriptional regulator [Ectobacillus panaciterrae]